MADKRIRTKLNFTRFMTIRERLVSVSKLLRSEDRRINEALDIATSPAVEVSQYKLHEEVGYMLTSRSNSNPYITGSQCLVGRGQNLIYKVDGHRRTHRCVINTVANHGNNISLVRLRPDEHTVPPP